MKVQAADVFPVSVINYRIMYVDQMSSRGEEWEEVTKTMFNLLKDHRVSPHYENKIVRLLFLGGTTLETLEYRKFRSAR